MQDHAAFHFDAILNRNPVLTAMMVTSLIIGVTASIAGVARWRANSACVAEQSAPHLAQDLTNDAGRADLTIRQTLQADLVLRVGQAAPGEPAPSRKAALTGCACAASSGWHWQRI
jgi:hypothetical protein